MKTPPPAPTLEPTFLDRINALPEKILFSEIRTAFLLIPHENRNPKQMDHILKILKQNHNVILVQTLFPGKYPEIAAHPTAAYTILQQHFIKTQREVDAFFTLLENPPTPSEPKNPPNGPRLARALAWINRLRDRS